MAYFHFTGYHYELCSTLSIKTSKNGILQSISCSLENWMDGTKLDVLIERV